MIDTDFVPRQIESEGLPLGRASVVLLHEQLECPESELEATARLVMEKMSSAYSLKVPLKTEARAGVNWGKMNSVALRSG